MKRILALGVVLLVAAGALYLAQHRSRQDSVNANAVVDAAADWQRDLTRVPMGLTRLSDDRETRIGDEIAQQYVSENPALTSKEQFTERYVNQVGGHLAAHAASTSFRTRTSSMHLHCPEDMSSLARAS
jgi:predicted Zn-dependent protease